MPTAIGSIRRLLLTPSLSEVSFAGRGFPGRTSAASRKLESIPQAVVCGFEWGIDAPGQSDVERRLSLVEPELRGFAYEGTTMAFTVLDAMGRGHRTRDLLLGPGAPHIFLSYIGIGFAMARLPRGLWKKVLPDLADSPYHPVMSWLAVDGFGFDLAYFKTRRWVTEQEVPSPYPWQGCATYFPRAVDQGIGRALWFIHGARVAEVAAAVDRFDVHRHADLWSGVGLAATYAGGTGLDGLTALRRAAGEHWADLALGMVFAVKARTFAEFVPPHTEIAAAALGGLSVGSALELADGTARHETGTENTPPYELWRGRIRALFLAAAAESSRPARQNTQK